MNNIYTEKVLDHFRNPRNMGKMDNPDGIGKVGNPKCGDVMVIYIKVKDKKIFDIKFQTFGCTAAIASSSITTELIKGKTLDEALKLTRNDIARELGGLPAIKIHCSLLATDALKAAIEDYYKKKKDG